MKKLLNFLICCLLLASVQAQTQNSGKLIFKETGYDFGSIQQGRPVTHVFEVTNPGNAPVRIENVQASCGCTTPVWSKEPIAPGASTEIRVGYNAAAQGTFHKTVSIKYEGDNMQVINITGDVYPAPNSSAPANAAIALLKRNSQ